MDKRFYFTYDKIKRRRRWVAALRSGKYTQGTYALRTGGPALGMPGRQTNHCCMGVICDISRMGKWDENRFELNIRLTHETKKIGFFGEEDRLNKYTGYPPDHVSVMYGFMPSNLHYHSEDATFYSQLNDQDRFTYPMIARVIEEVIPANLDEMDIQAKWYSKRWLKNVAKKYESQ